MTHPYDHPMLEDFQFQVPDHEPGSYEPREHLEDAEVDAEDIEQEDEPYEEDARYETDDPYVDLYDCQSPGS